MSKKYRVTMTNHVDKGNGLEMLHEAVDFVPEEILEAYVADAKTRWASVKVGKKVEYGPGGKNGETANLIFE